MEIMGEYKLSKKALLVLSEEYREKFVGRMAKLELIKNGWKEKNSGIENFLIDSLKKNGPLIEKSVSSNILSQIYFLKLKVKKGIEFFFASLNYSTITADKLLSGIVRKCINIGEYDIGKKYVELSKSKDELFFNSIIDFHKGDSKKSIDTIEKYLTSTPLIGDTDFNLSLLFLNYISTDEEKKEYLKWRTSLFSHKSSEVDLNLLKSSKDEILFNVVNDLINYKKNFGDKLNGLPSFELLNEKLIGDGVNSSIRGFEYIKELKRKGLLKKYKKELNKYVMQFPDSPFIFEVRDALKKINN
jgi:hypothetical protein